MLKFVLLLLTVSGLQALPIAAPKQRAPLTDQLPGGVRQGIKLSGIFKPIPDDFRQGTEPSRRFLVDLNTGLVKDHVSEMDRRVVPADVPAQRHGAGWVRVGEPSTLQLPDGFRQGTEPFHRIPDGFRQGTEPFHRIPDGFRQGTEPVHRIPDGFRQGTEPFHRIPDGFRQGTEPFHRIPDGFRQGTEPFHRIPDGFRQGTEPAHRIPDGFRQGTEPVLRIPEEYRRGAPAVTCKGEFINGKCYEFNPTPLAFRDAQASCRGLAPNAELASVTSGDLHSHLVSLVTKGGRNNPVLTWLGATVENQRPSWTDGSEWSYSDWMPGHPNIHTDGRVCVEMFKIDESWWTAADCELKRASICSYHVTA